MTAGPECAREIRRSVRLPSCSGKVVEPRGISLSALVTGRVCHRKVRGLARSPITQRLRLGGPGGEVTRHVSGGGIRVVRGFVQVGQGEACGELAADLPGE